MFRAGSKEDLNARAISGGEPLEDYSLAFRNGAVLFRNLEQTLISYIQRADVVVGCVAWFTSFPVIKALKLKDGVSIIVQKEDFLRPDSYASGWKWREDLRRAYNGLPRTISRFDDSLEDTSLYMLSYFDNDLIDPVRCVGMHDGSKFRPLMHHKFFVFCEVVEDESRIRLFKPYAVWTGSYNPTSNATRSFENAIYIEDTKIANRFFQEWGQIAALSEELDWKSDYVSPQWRIGS